MFQASFDFHLGDGNLALFWTDRWNGPLSPCVIAPDLCKLIRPRTRKRRIVAEAVHDKQWIQDIIGQLTVTAILQYLELWQAVDRIQLRIGTEDVVSWRRDSSNVFF
uniref:Uncharacterized protein n=1 Tax=Setaria viridis TaxID=4556 RepID=A0A4U6TKI2_SETVI|nr:hypothetical protein SEVIR_7G040400v2 [Setaria viridis]